MNKELLKDTKKAYATYRAILAKDILRVPMRYADVCAPTKLTISDCKKPRVTFKVEKLGVVGEAELKKTGRKLQIADIAPSSLISLNEAEYFLRKQKDGVAYIDQTHGIEICTRGMALHDDVLNALNGEPNALISIAELRQLTSYILGSTTFSPGLLLDLLSKMGNEAGSVDETPMASYNKKGSLLGDSPIKTDKAVRALRFSSNVSYASERDMLAKLSGDNTTCLKDFLAESHKDCEATERFILKSISAKINCYQTLATGAVKIYRGIYSHREHR